MVSRYRKKKSTNNGRNSLRNIDKGGKYIHQLNEGPDIKLYRVSRTRERRKNSSLSRIYFSAMEKSDILDIKRGGGVLYP